MVRGIALYLTNKVDAFYRLFYFAPSGLKIFARFATQGVALG